MIPIVRNHDHDLEIVQGFVSSSNKFNYERLVSGQKTICMDTDLHFDVFAVQQHAATTGNGSNRARKED